MTIKDFAEETCRPFSQAFFSALVAAISEVSGSSWLVSAVPDAQPAEDESEPVRMKLMLEGDLRGEFLLEFRRADAVTLAAKCLQQTASEFGTEQSEAVLKCVEAGMSRFCSAALEEYGTFAGKTSIVSGPASDRANVAEFTAADDGGNRVSLLMYMNPALAEALSLHAKKASADETDGNSKNAAKKKAGESNPEPLNLQLVMDVELNVTLRFGQRQLALREVLELTSGSVIELDRQVEEPVELLLEGKVIARGEAVVIDGNYGLRVTEVPNPISAQVLR
ncbi:MAG: flagellar motor switch protein FliN [Acidobacteriaceae bacterium]|jgi:flagellar motor switch protein FliN/FliY